jgi:hypothetical protein
MKVFLKTYILTRLLFTGLPQALRNIHLYQSHMDDSQPYIKIHPGTD